MLRIEDITLAPGSEPLLIDASWHLRPGARAGLVGRNGTGKSSLLRVLAGEDDPRDGRVYRRGDVRIGTLPQQAVSGSTATVWEEARSRMHWLHVLEERLARAEAAVQAHTDGAAQQLAEATEAMRLRGAFAADEVIGEVLHGLGFRSDDWHRTCDTFSGGWQMRIALARLLLSRPNLLLLDEPTNHLDITARSWLADYLQRYPSTLGEDCAMVVVSHDRHLLDAVCTETVEIRGRTLASFSGNLTAWLAERDRRDTALEVAKARQDAEVARLERFIERFGAKATKAAQANSRKKALEKIERIEGPVREGRPHLHLPDAPACALEPVVLRDASLGWPDSPAVLSDVDLVLERGMRLVVLGPNGCGKSTLMAGIAGTLPLGSGRRVVGRDVRMARYAQDLAQELPPDATAVQAVIQLAPLAPEPRARKALGALGLQGAGQTREIALLSGGEKARVVLAAFACRPANLLLLDEPTNHLDAVTVEALAEALKAYEGAAVIVTHDRWLVEQVATHVAHVGDGALTMHAGVRADDFLPPHRRTGTDGSALTGAGQDGASEAREDWEARKARQREQRRAERRLESIHDELEAAEQAVAGIDARMAEAAAAMGASGGDAGVFTALAQERDEAAGRVEALYAEWESLEAVLEA